MVLFVDNEAASAALTKGAAKNGVALMLVLTLSALAAQYYIPLGTGRVPPKVNPTDLSSRNKEIASGAEPKKELATIEELLPVCDLAWMLQQAD